MAGSGSVMSEFFFIVKNFVKYIKNEYINRKAREKINEIHKKKGKIAFVVTRNRREVS